MKKEETKLSFCFSFLFVKKYSILILTVEIFL